MTSLMETCSHLCFIHMWNLCLPSKSSLLRREIVGSAKSIRFEGRANMDHSAVVGFVRTYGVIMAQENITLNAVCPGIVETGISSHAPWYHAEARKRGCLVEMSQMMDAFSMLMGGEKMSGQCVEVVAKHGARVVDFPSASKESDIGGEISYKRNRPFHNPVE